MKNPLGLLRSWLRWPNIFKRKIAAPADNPPVVRYAWLKKRLLRELEHGPKSIFSLEKRMREDGFRTGKHVCKALQDLVDTGEVRIRSHQNGKAWIYEKSGGTLTP